MPQAELEERVVLTGLGGEPPSDPAGFAEWVSPHLGVLSALAIREVGPNDADDVVQDALVRAWRRRLTYRAERGSPRAWLVGVLLDRARRRRTRAARPLRQQHVAGDGAVPDALVHLDIENAVRALPRRQREVITLYYLADLGVDEVADLLRISSGTVKSHLHDAREALKIALEQR
jgi:RNA polymerase sigma factor (sigma-70 family)